MVNGEINVLRTHPNLYWQLTAFAVVGFGFGLNFFLFNPTFLIWHTPSEIWGAIFLLSSANRLVALNTRRLGWLRLTMGFQMAYFAFLAVGAGEVWLDGKGSLQLPIALAGYALVQFPLMFEPFLNPETAKG